MKQSDLKAIEQCTTDMIIFLLAVCFVVIGLFAALSGVQFWIGALYMVFLAFNKAISVAELEMNLNEY